MKGMKGFPDKHFELAIVDPPYGIGDFTKVGDANIYKKKADKKYGLVNWNDSIPTKEYFDELYRVSKERIIWGCNYYRKYIKDTGIIVWDKNNESSRWSKVEVASNSTSGINSIIKLTWNGFIRCEKVERIHSCQKPIKLYKWLLTKYAKEGDKILDTHLGSGSSRIAAYDMGFDFTGYELDKDYFDAQEKRFRQFTAQLKLI